MDNQSAFAKTKAESLSRHVTEWRPRAAFCQAADGHKDNAVSHDMGCCRCVFGFFFWVGGGGRAPARAWWPSTHGLFNFNPRLTSTVKRAALTTFPVQASCKMFRLRPNTSLDCWPAQLFQLQARLKACADQPAQLFNPQPASNYFGVAVFCSKLVIRMTFQLQARLKLFCSHTGFQLWTASSLLHQWQLFCPFQPQANLKLYVGCWPTQLFTRPAGPRSISAPGQPQISHRLQLPCNARMLIAQ